MNNLIIKNRFAFLIVVPFTLMLKISTSTDSSINTTKIVADYDGVDSDDFDRKFVFSSMSGLNMLRCHLSVYPTFTNNLSKILAK